ncbi:phosphopantetheine-binding protein, partial [Pedobacter jeongneungensis]|uniref:phosphopantetheine-binding protein n=1 Tax=Pedobacter jeongneungensis TaxID=947309 RepID=UPI0031E8E7B2
PGGKVDRGRLPDPEGLGLSIGTEYVAPENEVEEKLVEIWKEILGKDRIGIKDNFFDLGGDSIKIIRLSKLISDFLGKEISVTVLFQYFNIQGFVGFISQKTIEQEEDFDRNGIIEDLNKINF